MPELSITSAWFLLCLLCTPLLMNKNAKIRSWLFLILNIGIYISILGNWQSSIAILLFVFVPYFYLALIQKRDVSVWPLAVIQIVAFLYINKYVWLLDLFGIQIPDFIKLTGISYILFRQFDIILQVKAKLVNDVPVIDYLNYLLSFWTIIAGPIQRYRQFVQTFYENKKPLGNKEALKCFHRATNGLLKILVLGTFFKYIADAGYFGIIDAGYSLKRIIGMFYGYPLYVYFNFSGYCDVVIAMGRWTGFEIPENFNKPYLSRDMIEMWNRWHMTLSHWIRDYVYQPFFKYLISGPSSKQVKVSQYISIFVTFFLAGIWHGATINFIVFGLLQGMGMAISMIYRDQSVKRLGKLRYKKYYENRLVGNIERFITLNFWCFTFLFFEYDVHIVSGWIFKLLGAFTL